MSFARNVLTVLLVTVFAIATAPGSSTNDSRASLKLEPKTVPTNPTRTANVNRYCNGKRSELVTDGQLTIAASNHRFLANFFHTDGYEILSCRLRLIGGIIREEPQTVASAKREVSGGFTSTLFFGVLGLFLVIAASLLMLLYYIQRCGAGPLRQNIRNWLYKAIMITFLVLLIFLFCMVIAGKPKTLFLGFVEIGMTAKGINSSACAASILFDDVLNGNISTSDEHYFIGTTKLHQWLTTITNNVTALANDLNTSAKASLQTLQTRTLVALTQLQVLASSTPNTSFVLEYNDPTEPITNSKVTSIYGGLLGNPTLPQTLIGKQSKKIKGLKDLVDPSISGLDGFDNAAFSSSISAVATTITNLTNSIVEMDNTVEAKLKMLTLSVNPINGLLIVFYILVLVSVSMIVAYSVKTKRIGELNPYFVRHEEEQTVNPPLDPNNPQNPQVLDENTRRAIEARNEQRRAYLREIKILFYTTFGFLAGTGTMGMCLMIWLGTTLPVLHMSCSALNTGLSSPTAFDSNSKTYVGLANELRIPVNVSGILRQCLPGGSASILTGMGTDGATFNSNFGSIVSTTAAANSTIFYDFSSVVSSSASLEDTTNSMISAAINDISGDSKSLYWFQRTAIRTYSTACSGNPIYVQDSLVPSTDPRSLSIIPCAAGTPVVSCSDFSNCASGCIDMFSVMAAAADLATFTGQINTRYGASAICAAEMTNQFTTNYNRWFLPRVDAISLVKVKWLTTGSLINSVITGLEALKTIINSTLSNAGNTPSIIAKQGTGLYAGMDCTLINDDLQLIKNTVCARTFSNLFASFIMVSIVSYVLIVVIIMFFSAGKEEFQVPEEGVDNIAVQLRQPAPDQGRGTQDTTQQHLQNTPNEQTNGREGFIATNRTDHLAVLDNN